MNFEYQIRVRYAETDQMGFVYYGNYAQYFEVGRVEFLHTKGYSYKSLEDEGIMMPVAEMNIKYKRPAVYDNLLTIKTSINTLDKKRVTFNQSIYNENNKLLTEGTVELAFLDSKNMKSIECPEKLFNILKTITNV